MPERVVSPKQMEAASDFSRMLPRIRKEYGVSQAELGERVGLSRQTISSIERGTVPMSWNTFLAMIAFFYVNRTKTRRAAVLPDFESYLNIYLEL